MKLVFECPAPMAAYATGIPSPLRIVGWGVTAAEVNANAKQKAVALGCDPTRLRALSLHNSRRDWEARFGPCDPTHHFADDDNRS